jgi:Ca2+-binding EF-hand superfamily protein
MGNEGSKAPPLEASTLDGYVQSTVFGKKEVQVIYKAFFSIAVDDTVSFDSFMAMPQIAANHFVRPMLAFFGGSDEILNLKEFVQVLSFLSPRTRADSKVKAVFHAFDDDKDNQLSEAELCNMLTALVGSTKSHEYMKAVTAEAMLAVNVSKSGFVTEPEFGAMLVQQELQNKLTVAFFPAQR